MATVEYGLSLWFIDILLQAQLRRHVIPLTKKPNPTNPKPPNSKTPQPPHPPNPNTPTFHHLSPQLTKLVELLRRELVDNRPPLPRAAHSGNWGRAPGSKWLGGTPVFDGENLGSKSRPVPANGSVAQVSKPPASS